MKLISNQINPHFTLQDALVAASKIFVGNKVEYDWSKYFGTSNYRLTNTARSALGIIADTIKPDKTKKIGLPAFICGVVATPFLERGYEIEWIDVEVNGCFSAEDFRKKASGISLIVVPHIFGQPASLKDIYKIAKAKGIFMVEDGAHLLNKNFDHCDAKIWSFGREKVVSCVSGGALLWKDGSPFHKQFSSLNLPAPSLWWQIRHALQPLIFAIAQPWWKCGGKIFPALMRKINFLPLAVTAAEKKGREDVPVTALGVVQQRILQMQWKNHAARTKQAHELATQWKKLLVPILTDGTQVIIPENAFRVILKFKNKQARQNFTMQTKSLNLNDWNGLPISPKGVDLTAFGYQVGQCPQAEKYAQTYLTLPTNIWVNKRDLNKMAEKLQSRKIQP